MTTSEVPPGVKALIVPMRCLLYAACARVSSFPLLSLARHRAHLGRPDGALAQGGLWRVFHGPGRSTLPGRAGLSSAPDASASARPARPPALPAVGTLTVSIVSY